MKNIKIGYMYIILIVYTFITILFSKTMGLTYTNYINPIFWISFLILIIATKNNNFNKKNYETKEHQKELIIVMLTYTIIYALIGLIFDYTRSPYSKEPIILLKNTFIFVVIPIIIEYVRSTLLNANKNKYILLILTFIMIFLLKINYILFFNNLLDKENLFKYVFSILIPLFANELLCTYLSLKGTYRLSFIYVTILNMLNIYMPIYPKLDWFGSGIISLLLSLITYIVLKYNILKRDKTIKKRRKIKENPIYYIPFITVIIIFALFMMGRFIYSPLAILSNSMYPVYSRGDVIVYKKTDENNLKKLDKDTIIIYIIDNQVVTHRIVDIINKKGEIYYQTQGDNNVAPDMKLVSTNQVLGVYKFHIKYIGYPSVYLNDLFNDEEAVVETK